MGLVNVKSKKSRIKYKGGFPNGKWSKWEYNENGSLIYMENYKGEWEKRKYNENNQEIYYVNSRGHWEKMKHDTSGNLIYFETSEYGALIKLK